MLNIELIIFDFDGTLVDSRIDIVNAVNFTLRQLNQKEKSFPEIVSFIGGGIKDLLKKSISAKDGKLLKKATAIFIRYYQKHATYESKLYPHVEKVLKYFFQKKRMVVVTNRTKAMARVSLKSLKIDKYFEQIIGGDDEHCLKPTACPIKRALGSVVQLKGKSLIVGDMDIDILAGKQAGIFTCGVTYGIGKRKDILKAKPHYVIDDILTLKRIIS